MSSLAAYYNQIQRSAFALNVFKLTSGTALSQVISAVGSIIIARLYTPADIGIWSLFVNTILILGPVISLRYEQAIVLPKKSDAATHLFFLGTAIALLLSIIITTTTFFFCDEIASYIGEPELVAWMWLAGPLLLATGLHQLCTFWFTRHKLFGYTAVSLLIKTSFILLLHVGFAMLFERGFGWLLAGTIFGNILAVFYVIWQVMNSQPYPAFTSISAKRLIDVLLEYRNFAIFNSPYSFLVGLTKKALFIILAAYASTTAVGYFTLAVAITQRPAGFITVSLRQVFYQKASVARNSEHFEYFTTRLLQVIAWISIPFAILLFVHSEAIIVFLLGSEWEPAGAYVRWLLLPALASFLTNWLDRLYDICGRQRLALSIEIIYDFIVLAAVLVSAQFLEQPIIMVAIFSSITALKNVIWLAITFRIAGFAQKSFFIVAKSVVVSLIGFTALYYLLSNNLSMLVALSSYFFFVLIALGLAVKDAVKPVQKIAS